MNKTWNEFINSKEHNEACDRLEEKYCNGSGDYVEETFKF